MGKKNVLKEYIQSRINGTKNYYNYWKNIIDLDNIPEDALNRQYKELHLAAMGAGYGNVFFDGRKCEILKEDATYTMPYEDTIKELKRLYKLDDWQTKLHIESENGANKVQLVVVYADLYENKQLIKDTLHNCGWSLSLDYQVNKDGRKWNYMSFEPMFQDDVTEDALSHMFLFHITPLYNKENIEKNGLEPRSENIYFKYPKRVHVLKGNITEDEVIRIGYQLYLNNTNVNNDGRYVFFAILTQLLPKDIKFFYDPRFEKGYYSKQNIPAECMRAIKIFDLKTKQTIDLPNK